jgi:uncharacterized damage-inducible protein DinB
MNSFFKELFEYNHHTNQKLIAAISEHTEQLPEKCAMLMSHMLNAHQIWNSRIARNEASFGVWDIHPMENWKDINQKNYEHTLLILDKFDLNDMINYTNTKGQTFSNVMRDMLFQVINHYSYHRGQIAVIFRESGLEPLLTDYIFYKR